MGDRISLKDVKQISQIYLDLAGTNVRALQVFYQDVSDLCRKCGYEPMVHFANHLGEFYQGEFRSHMLAEYHRWEESSCSPVALMRKIGAGREAENTARRSMEDVLEGVESLFRLNVSKIVVDTSEPALSSGDIQRMDEFLMSFLAKSRAAKDRALSSVNCFAEDNQLFKLIKGMVRSTANSYEACMSKAISEVENGGQLFSRGVWQVVAEGDAKQGHAVETGRYIRWWKSLK